MSQQAELISWQLQELRRLEEEVRTLRETSLQQKMRLEAQALELDALAVAEKAGQAEAEGLRAALAGAEMVRKNLEEGNQRDLQEIQSLHQEQVNLGVRGAEQRFEVSFPADCRERQGQQSHGVLEGELGWFGLPRAALASWESCDLAPFETLQRGIPPYSMPSTLPGAWWTEGVRKRGVGPGEVGVPSASLWLPRGRSWLGIQ